MTKQIMADKDSNKDIINYYHSIIESESDAIITSDASKCIRSWNKGAEHIFGYTSEEAIGQPMTLIIPTQLHKRHNEGINRMNQGKPSRVIGEVLELKAVKKDGEEIPIELTLGSWDNNGKKYYSGIIRDISEKKQAEQILLDEKKRSDELLLNIEKAYTELKTTQTQLIHSEKMKSLGELTAGIAHEIQNPLNFVNNFSEVNKELIEELKEAQVKGDQEEIDAITKDILENEDKILHHGKRAEGIVKSMLQHSRTSSGEKELTDINALVDEYLRLAYHSLRAKDQSFNAEFKTELDQDLPKVNVVPQDIGRVMLNLINNAFQAVAKVDKPKVVVSTSTNNGQVEIKVKDNGIGIPEDIKDKVFQPFFTTKATGEGTGLGLSMSYDIVTMGHGGSIELEIMPAEGSEFIIKLPIL